MKNKYIFKLKTAFALLAFLGFQQNAMAQSEIIDVSEDTYVRGGSFSGDNFGTEVEARSRDTATSAPRIAYFKFPVGGSLPASVTSATLKFHTYLPSSSPKTEIMQIHKLGNGWSEGVVTFDTKPDTGAFISELEIENVAVSSPNDYSKSYTVDVTAYFNQVLAASGTDISFAIKAKNKDDFSGTLGPGQEGNVRNGTKEFVIANPGLPDAAATITINYTLGVNDINNNQFPLTIYPNPASSIFTLNRTFKTSDELEVSVFNIFGAKVSSFKENVNPGVWKKELNTQQFSMQSGIYMLKVSSKLNGTSVSKLVVK